jgi:predicted RNA methylase
LLGRVCRRHGWRDWVTGAGGETKFYQATILEPQRAMIVNFAGTRIMAKKDLSAQLRKVDRWSSRKKRSIEFLQQNGVSGLVAKVREVGPGETAKFVKRQVRYHACSFMGARWDRQYDVDTSGQIDLKDIDVVGQNKNGGHSAVSISPRAYEFLSALFPTDWKEFTFVDVGCGKGRVLMLAALQGFETIIGIEFAPLICQIAQENLVRFSGRRPAKWFVVNADATAIDLPSGVPLLIYCCNPFNAEIWKMYLPVLLKTYEANKKPMCLILSGTMRETLHAVAAVITGSSRFRERACGVSPFFVDAYSPYYYWAFDAT